MDPSAFFEQRAELSRTAPAAPVSRRKRGVPFALVLLLIALISALTWWLVR
jgi:hypothetical protein